MKFLKSITLTIVSFLFITCNKTKPSGFWLDYKSNLIASKHTDNGPYGGETRIVWKNKRKFESRDIINYAENNGWKLIDSLKSDSEKIQKSNYSNEILIDNVLSALKEKDLTIYRFKTGWIAIKPGNESDTEINGFVTINSERTQLAVYQLWGE